MSRTISTSVDIDAPVAHVWDVLTDLAGYRRWNPFITTASGTVEVGARLRVTIEPSGARPMTFRPTVTQVQLHHRIEWLGRLGVPGIFDGRHSFILTETPEGRTELHHAETFTGILVPLMPAMLARTEAGFLAMNDALARRAVGRQHGATGETHDGTRDDQRVPSSEL